MAVLEVYSACNFYSYFCLLSLTIFRNRDESWWRPRRLLFETSLTWFGFYSYCCWFGTVSYLTWFCRTGLSSYTCCLLSWDSGFFTLFLELYCCSNLVISLFSMLQKWECWSPVSYSSSVDHTGLMLHCFLAALVIEQAIKYWFVFTSLWSWILKRTKNSMYFSMRLMHLSS